MTPNPDADAPAADARAEYLRRLQDRQARLARCSRADDRLADARLAVFVIGLGVLGIWVGFRGISWAWSLVPFAGFVALLAVHDRVRRARLAAERSVAFYEKGLKRLGGDWAGTGTPGDRLLVQDHPYAADLDLFGVGSVFERLCTARTRAGEDTLAAWLLAPAEPATILARQAAITELRPRLDLREDLELIGVEVREGIDPESLAAWGKAPAVFHSRWGSVIAYALGAGAALGLVAWVASPFGAAPLFAVVMAVTFFTYREKDRILRVVESLRRRTHDLVILAELLARLEREPFQTPTLRRLRQALETDGEPASRRVARLARLVGLLESQKNQFFTPFAFLMLWSYHFAVAIDAWRVKTGPAIAEWLAAVGEFEALGSLAAYSFECPDDPFPEIDAETTCYEGESIGHPLIRSAECVRNDVRLGGDLRALLISGSNMSGKSTLLRTVGTNAVLALAGAPVRAKRLKLSVLSLGATLRIQDSLQAGRSRFYAEVARVKLLVDISNGPRPLLFLLDEIFHGTNSHDRVAGAGALVKGLIDRGAIGLVTTHDLALAEVAEGLAPRALNVHFEDQFVDGTMRFDYRMRPGVVRHSNALALMRAVGLDV